MKHPSLLLPALLLGLTFLTGRGLETNASTTVPGFTVAVALPKAVSPNDPKLYYVGRFDRSDLAGPRCAWSASTVKLNFFGTALNVLMKDAGPDYWDLLVDKRRVSVIALKQDQTLYTVVSGLPPGEHMVELVKRTEFNVGTTQILGFQLESNGQLLAPPAVSNRRLEVIGDSISCGYGIEAPTREEAFTPQRENANLAYGALAARDLGADYMCIAWSGKKLWPDNSILDYYDAILPKTEGDTTWDFSSWTPDAIVINLGTNDFGVSDPDGPGWVGAYRALIQRLRKQYPQAWIYPTEGTMLGDWPAPRKPASAIRGYLTNLMAEFNAAGDTKVRFIDFGQRQENEGFGGGWHPSQKSHRRMADDLIVAMKKDLGW